MIFFLEVFLLFDLVICRGYLEIRVWLFYVDYVNLWSLNCVVNLEGFLIFWVVGLRGWVGLGFGGLVGYLVELVGGGWGFVVGVGEVLGEVEFGKIWKEVEYFEKEEGIFFGGWF